MSPLTGSGYALKPITPLLIRSRRFIPYVLYAKKFLKCAKIAFVKQKPSGLENTCKNTFITSQIKQGFS